MSEDYENGRETGDEQESPDALAFHSEEPDIAELREEMRRSFFDTNQSSYVNDSDNMRFCRWSGQSDDGKKHTENLDEGQQAFPFEGASDVRIRLIDKIINQLVVLMMTSWQRSKLRISGTEMQDAQTAKAIEILVCWLVENKLRADLEREAELWAQYALQFGWSVAHVGWERGLGVRKTKISMSDLEQLAQQGGAIEAAYRQLVETGENDMTVMFICTAFQLTESEGRRVVKELMEDRESEFDSTYILKNQPIVVALKPYDEIAFPPETLNLQDARVVFRRTYMSEVELRGIAQAEKWDDEFVQEAINTAGKSAWELAASYQPAANWTTQNFMEKNTNLIEIVYAYTRQISESGAPCIYYTVFCPNTSEDCYGKHEMLDYAHGDYPFVEFRRERLRRNIMESRGIPEIVYTDQEEIKAQHDSIRDRTAFETMPPLTVKRRNGTQNSISPGCLLPVNGPDDYKFLSPPTGTPQIAFNLIEKVEARAAEYFGVYHPAVPQITTQLTQQFLVNNWLLSWSQVYRQLVSLCLQYMTPGEVQRVTGLPLQFAIQDISQMFDINPRFDVRELDTDYVIEKLKNIAQFVIPMDTGGVVDRNKIVQKFIEAIAPESAKELVIDQGTATSKLYKDVQNDVSLMMLGMEAQYTENDPQANAKLQALQDILQKNPKAIQASQGDGVFQALLQNYSKNLQMSMMQQQNKQIGRTGVTPVGDQFAQQMQQGEDPSVPQQ